MRAVAATGNLSTGFKEESLVRAMKLGAAFVGCDAGTTDSGPYYLGSGNPRGPRDGVKRNLGLLIREALKGGVPLIIGSAGHAGGRPHVNWTVQIVRELARENDWHFQLAAIESEIDKERLAEALEAGAVTPLHPATELSVQSIRKAERFVAMMGIEPIQAALRAGAQVVIAGRCSDVAIYAALPVLEGIPKAVAFHAGKILECGAASVAQRLYPDCMMAELDEAGFTVEPPNEKLRCTPQSVAAHTLYENADPYHLVESGGTLDTTAAKYAALSDRAVRVTGSRFLPAKRYTVRVEGATLRGFRSVVFAGIRDPLVVRELPTYLATLRSTVQSKIEQSLGLKVPDYSMNFRVYGGESTASAANSRLDSTEYEVGLLIDVIADSQSIASDILPIVWHTGLHHPIPEYEGLISNFAFPFSPPGIDVGPVYQFCANHIWQLDDPCAPFPISMERL
jgi:hypothetical protein